MRFFSRKLLSSRIRLVTRSSIRANATRRLTTLNTMNNVVDSEPRDEMEYDVLIVGAGPAGLSAAIRLKQLEAETGKEISVCVVEKAAEVGAHILSGNVFEPRALNELFPGWQDDPNIQPFGEEPTMAKDDNFVICLNDKSSISLPSLFIPPMLHNEGNYIISLGKLVRFLGEQAENMGVEIYPGFPASEIVYSEDGSRVVGVATKDVGISKEGEAKDTFTRGIELKAKQTIFSEGARGSCSEELIKKFNLRENCDNQAYGLGIKEVWEVDPNNPKFSPGKIQHTLGWPLDNSTYGGSFLYHMKPNFILVGMVVGLDYQNPYINPYKEFQRLKHHPSMSQFLEGGTCVSYGARVINEGGFQSIPKLTAPGAVLVGCSAGFVNVPKIKGTHTAMKSAMLAAESIFENLSLEENDQVDEVISYQQSIENSWVWDEMKSVRNFAPSFKYGTFLGTIYSGISGLILKGREPWTLKKFTDDKPRDCDKTLPLSDPKAKEIDYPKPDGVLSFDILENLARSGTNHEGDQPSHLVIKQELADVPENVSLQKYGGPEQRFCPAKVYEYVDGKLVINAQNCVHCKCCSIKMKDEYIQWTVPEGGGGPAYEIM